MKMQGRTIKERLQRQALVGRKVVNIHKEAPQELYKMLMPGHTSNRERAMILKDCAAAVERMKEDGFKGHIICVFDHECKSMSIERVK